VGQTLGQIVAEYEYDDPEGLLTAVEYPATPGRNASLTYDGYGPSPDGTENY